MTMLSLESTHSGTLRKILCAEKAISDRHPPEGQKYLDCGAANPTTIHNSINILDALETRSNHDRLFRVFNLSNIYKGSGTGLVIVSLIP